MHDEGENTRNVIPRWRPLVAIEKRDLTSPGRFGSETHVNSARDFASDLKIWSTESGVASASDIFDTYILTGDISLLKDAISQFEKNKEQLPPRLRFSLEDALRKPKNPLDVRREIAFKETDEKYLISSVSILKARIANFPRDALSYLELARLYTILGNFEKAENCLFRAKFLAPENRVILRATMQFYNTVGNLEDGLKIIQRSERLKYDPWIQSAEIAVATALNKGSRAASRKIFQGKKTSAIIRDRTELAMAMATLEDSSGLPERKVFQLVKRALPNTTENGFAQAIWLCNHSSREFLSRFPEAKPSSEAYEAKLKLAIAEKDFEAAAGFAELWVEDQPFSTDAIIRFLNLRSVHLETNDAAVKCALRSMQNYSTNWHVLNACILALTEAGQFSDARTALNRLVRSAPSGAPKAFVQAASGFLAFGEGNFVEGRAGYDQAAKIALEHKQHHLLLNSTMFWLRCEAKNGLISPQCIADLSSVIEGALLRVKPGEREHLDDIWFSTKQIVAHIELPEDKAPEKLPLITFVAEKLEDPTLFPLT